MLTPGTPAPDFAVEDESGSLHRLSDYRGRTLVLWFYPKADTPGCTAEGCGFRDRTPQFAAKGIAILGASFDDAAANRSFKEKFAFPFPLLCDTTRALGLAYGACDDANAKHARRISVVVGPDGNVLKVYDQVDARNHPAQVLADLGA
ncbi:MAG TPA: peroxiredoxin [Planctomycetota bacterium]|nr:peroxiredoxin [Planctomycetota bacterium]